MKIKITIKFIILTVGSSFFILHSPVRSDVATNVNTTDRTISCQQITPLCEKGAFPEDGTIYQTCCKQGKDSAKLLKLRSDHLKLMSKFLSETGDNDHDGVVNMSDRCPKTPPNTAVDFKGCHIDTNEDGIPDLNIQCLDPNSIHVSGNKCIPDTDGDGINDNKDKCPNSPKNTPTNSTGCMVDFDNDGVGDLNDRCIDTPPNVKTNPQGCELDADNDDVADSKDLCNTTTKGMVVNAMGCKKDEHILLKEVSFTTGANTLLPASLLRLDAIATTLQRHTKINVEISGHTDSKGKEALNLALSHKRATTVKDYLISKGVSKDHITAVGYGESHPISSNKTEQGRSENRRVELIVLP